MFDEQWCRDWQSNEGEVLTLVWLILSKVMEAFYSIEIVFFFMFWILCGFETPLVGMLPPAPPSALEECHYFAFCLISKIVQQDNCQDLVFDLERRHASHRPWTSPTSPLTATASDRSRERAIERSSDHDQVITRAPDGLLTRWLVRWLRFFKLAVLTHAWCSKLSKQGLRKAVGHLISVFFL